MSSFSFFCFFLRNGHPRNLPLLATLFPTRRSSDLALKGMDSLLSIVQMPAGIPVGTLAIGKAGAVNAALLAAAMLATSDEALAARLEAWRKAQTDQVAEQPE